MKIKELKIKSEKELQQTLKEEREHLRELKFDLASKKLKKVRELRESKKLIARVLTLMNEKRGEGVNVVDENIQTSEKKGEVNNKVNKS